MRIETAKMKQAYRTLQIAERAFDDAAKAAGYVNATCWSPVDDQTSPVAAAYRAQIEASNAYQAACNEPLPYDEDDLATI